jgi:hypothetical protein
MVLYDADWLVNLGDEYDTRDHRKLARAIDRLFLTDSGRALARKLYLGSGSRGGIDREQGLP